MNCFFISFARFVGQEEFTTESIESVKSILLGACFHATVTGYHFDNIPFVQLTKRYGRVISSSIEISQRFSLLFFSLVG